MRTYHVSALVGLVTTVFVSTALPVQAEPKVYLEVSGKESLNLDPDGLAVLESLGLVLDFVENTAEPDPGFIYAWDMLPPPQEPDERGTTFTFSYDPDTNVYIPQGGVEDFVGRIFFDVDTTKLTLDSPLALGDISVVFGPGFDFFAIDTATTNLPLFDIISSGQPAIDLSTNTWTLDDIDVVATEAFNDFLQAAGADPEINITGLKIAEARSFRSFVEVNATQVPESRNSLAILITASTALVASWLRSII